MIELAEIIGFDWDDGNSRKSEEKHNVSQEEAEQVFSDPPPLISNDEKHSDTEARFHALGISDENRLLHVSFTLRESNTLIRIISAQDMNRKERGIYEKS